MYDWVMIYNGSLIPMRVLFVTDWKTLGAFSVYRLIGIFGQVSIPHHVLVEQGLYLYFNLDGPRVGLID